MDTMVSALVANKIRPLHYSIDVMFLVNEKYGSINQALDTMGGDGKEAFEVLRVLATAMVNDAELCRRAEGYPQGEMISEDMISVRMSPAVYLALKLAVSQAVNLGYKQELADENAELDLGLLELRKKEEAGE